MKATKTNRKFPSLLLIRQKLFCLWAKSCSF